MRAYKIAIGVFTTVVVALVAAPFLVPRVSRHRSEVAISKVGAARLVAEVAALKEKAPALQPLAPALCTSDGKAFFSSACTSSFGSRACSLPFLTARVGRQVETLPFGRLLQTSTGTR
jgi:hypothetical protein